MKASISFLSLCPMGANTIQTVYKSEEGKECSISLTTLIKGEMTEQGEILAVVYAPDMVDSEGDTASAEVIKEFAYDFAVNGQGIDIKHDGDVLPTSDIFVAESFIVQKNDPRFEDTKDYEGNTIDVTGGWAVVLKVNNEDLRKQYRDGEWAGISMGGFMMVKEEGTEVSKLAKIVNKLIEAFSGSDKATKKLEKEMNKDEIKELTETITKSVTDNVLAVQKKVDEDKVKAKKEEDKKPAGLGCKAPVLKADSTPEDIDVHEKKLLMYELSKAVDPTDLTSIRDYQKLCKDIAAGKDVDVTVSTTGAKKSDSFSSFFATNQVNDTTSAVAGKIGDGDNAYGDAILAKLDKADAAKAKA